MAHLSPLRRPGGRAQLGRRERARRARLRRRRRRRVMERATRPAAAPVGGRGRAALGITGAKFAAYDVWGDTPLADVGATLSAKLEPRSSLTVALRAALARPQVVGTSRHVVQGAVDLTDERWAQATRTLYGKSVNLDGQPYTVTIAVPRGMRAATCKSDLPCTVKRLPGGQAVLQWQKSDGRDLSWEVKFRLVGQTPGKPPSR